MVKNSLKLDKVNTQAQAMMTVKDKKKQAKLKILKSEKYAEKVLEEHLNSSKHPKKKKKEKKGILGSLSALEASLNSIKYEKAEKVKNKLSKKEKQLISNQDTQRFEAVLQNKNFIANPLEAIRQHLQSQYNK